MCFDRLTRLPILRRTHFPLPSTPLPPAPAAPGSEGAERPCNCIPQQGAQCVSQREKAGTRDQGDNGSIVCHISHALTIALSPCPIHPLLPFPFSHSFSLSPDLAESDFIFRLPFLFQVSSSVQGDSVWVQVTSASHRCASAVVIA